MRAQHYDVVLLGDRTPTLLGAAFLARRGFRVLLLTEETLAERSGSVAFMLPLESPPIRSLLEALALLPTIRRRVLTTEWAASIRYHERSLDLPRDGALRLAVFEREFPGSASKLSRFERSARELLAAFDALLEAGHGPFTDGFFAKRARRSFERRRLSESLLEETDPIAPLRSQLPLLRVFHSLLSLHTGLPAKSLPPAAQAIVYLRLLEGSVRVDGGEAWLRERLLEAFLDHGGAIERKRNVGQLLVKRGHIDGIRFSDGREEIGASMIISGLREERLRSLLGAPPLPHRETIASTVVHIPQHALPVGFGAHLYFRPRGAQARGLTLYLERIGEPVGGTHRYQLIARGDDKSIQRAQLEAAFAELLPLSHESIEFDSPLHAAAPRVYASSDGRLTSRESPSGHGRTLRRASHYSVHPSGASRSLFDFAALPIERSPRGLFFAGPDSLPALGVEGEFLAVEAACRRALRSSLGRSHARFHPLRSLD